MIIIDNLFSTKILNIKTSTTNIGNVNPLLKKRALRSLIATAFITNDEILSEINNLCRFLQVGYDKVSEKQRTHIYLKSRGRLIKNEIYEFYQLKKEVLKSYNFKIQEILINYSSSLSYLKSSSKNFNWTTNPIPWIYGNNLVDFMLAYKHRPQLLMNYIVTSSINSFIYDPNSFKDYVSRIELHNLEFLKNTKYVITPVVRSALEKFRNINHNLPKSQIICATLIEDRYRSGEEFIRLDPKKFLEIKKEYKKKYKIDFRKISDMTRFCDYYINRPQIKVK